MVLTKIINFIKDPVIRFNYLARHGFYNKLDDETYLKKAYSIKMKKKLDLKNPKTFNEKLQWLKIHDRKDIYTTMVDKYEAKKYVADIIGEEYIIPTLGVYDKFDDIDFDKLPNQFVVKCTHDSGGLAIVKDKTKMNKKAIRKEIEKFLKRNYYNSSREWPYKNVKPRIIIEKYMVDESGYELKDYKFFCFNGEVKYIQVDFDRFKKHTKNIYDRNWNFVDVQINYPNDKERHIEKPKQLGKMIEFAERLSKGHAFLRVDFYSIEDKIYFGELTFFPGSGNMPFKPEKWDRTFGEAIELFATQKPILKDENLISVIVPTYNSINSINNLIESIEKQTYHKYELLFVDDGSSDDTYNYLKQYMSSKKNIYVYQQEHAGPGVARKLGYEKSHGDLLFFVDSDDWIYEPGSLSKINKIFSENDIDICFAPRKAYPSGVVMDTFRGAPITPGIYGLDIFNSRRFRGNMGGKIFKREKFAHNMFVETSNFEDILTTYRYLDVCEKIMYIDEIFQINNRAEENYSLTKSKGYAIKTLPQRAAGIIDTYPKIKSQYLKTGLADLALITYCDFITKKITKKHKRELIELEKIISAEDLTGFYPIYSKKKRLILWYVKHKRGGGK